MLRTLLTSVKSICIKISVFIGLRQYLPSSLWPVCLSHFCSTNMALAYDKNANSRQKQIASGRSSAARFDNGTTIRVELDRSMNVPEEWKKFRSRHQNPQNSRQVYASGKYWFGGGSVVLANNNSLDVPGKGYIFTKMIQPITPSTFLLAIPILSIEF